MLLKERMGNSDKPNSNNNRKKIRRNQRTQCETYWEEQELLDGLWPFDNASVKPLLGWLKMQIAAAKWEHQVIPAS